jgi:hypothetical protein
LIRAACNSGHVLQGFELTIDGVPATRESVPYLDMTAGITRPHNYSDHNLSWRAGWQTTLGEGTHKLVLRRAENNQAPALILDAIGIQPAKDMSLTK